MVCLFLVVMGFQAVAGAADLSNSQLVDLSRNILAKNGILADNIKIGATYDLGSLIARGTIDVAALVSKGAKNSKGTINKLEFQVQQPSHTLNYNCFLVVQPNQDNTSVKGCTVEIENYYVTQIATGSLSENLK
jgi:hypothetical protein